MKDKIKVITKYPNQVAGSYKTIDNTLGALQKIVGGYIEAITAQFDPELLIICNEEGKLQGLEQSFVIADQNGNVLDSIHGPVIVCGADGEDFDDVPITVDEWHKMLWNWGNT